MRSAEKKRVSTCAFADSIARLSLNEYQRICPPTIRDSYRQTVLSSILIENMDLHSLELISFGVGTKYMKHRYVDSKTRKLSSQHLNCVRDCHAEILARRGFLCFLYREIESFYQHVLDSLEQDPTTDLRTLRSALLEFNSASLPFKRNSAGERKLSSLLQVRFRENLRLHLYTSSSPCGNACLKRWAKGQTIQPIEMSESEYPAQPHPRLHVTAPQEGQVTVLTKKQSGIKVCYVESEQSEGSEQNLLTDERQHLISSLLSQLSPPLEHYFYTVPSYPSQYLSLGTAHPSSYPLPLPHETSSLSGLSMTCSDKITTWNAVGIQGALLAHLVSDPIYLTTITIGRKYSVPHVYRGLCCRAQDYQYPLPSSTSDPLPPLYSCHHPILLCTALKLDEGVIVTAEPEPTASPPPGPPPPPSLIGPSDALPPSAPSHVGANFDDIRCLCFSRQIDQMTSNNGNIHYDESARGGQESIFEVIDGESGMLFQNDEEEGTESRTSSFCSMRLFERYQRCEKLRERVGEVLERIFATDEVRRSTPLVSHESPGAVSLDEYLLVKRVGYCTTEALIAHPDTATQVEQSKGANSYSDAKHALLTSKKHHLRGWLRTTTLLKDYQAHTETETEEETGDIREFK
jgi:hypothetical protein